MLFRALIPTTVPNFKTTPFFSPIFPSLPGLWVKLRWTSESRHLLTWVKLRWTSETRHLLTWAKLRWTSETRQLLTWAKLRWTSETRHLNLRRIIGASGPAKL
ncbi:hypothetical protein AVEN_99579-1 [Araneus ventricosus]|uniref:Uncharacterized protein n=1 Tax=Araneus ventricosus TaxID=182803 RepID=A0A4Y2RUA9_ARAVE|nr:hypothetical protein AVEN_99579-1 [Araneus ventricosus]